MGRQREETEREIERLERKGRQRGETEKGDRKKRREGKAVTGDREVIQGETKRGDREGETEKLYICRRQRARGYREGKRGVLRGGDREGRLRWETERGRQRGKRMQDIEMEHSFFCCLIRPTL